MTMVCSTAIRSSLELMLDAIQQRDEQSSDMPPALPVRPVSKARLPSARRGFPGNPQKGRFRGGFTENDDGEKRDEEPNLQFGVSESKRTKRESFDNGHGLLRKDQSVDVVDDTRKETLLQGILEIQKFFRCHQAHSYYLHMKRGTVLLQSFIRGEKARKDYRRMEAVIIIQKLTRKWIARKRMQERMRAAICLQSVIRGWLARRCLDHERNLRLPKIEDRIQKNRINSEAEDLVRISPLALSGLQKRLLGVESELGQKEDENASLRQQLQHYDKMWSQYEEKMKSMEMMWQDQLTSLQTSLAEAKKGLSSEQQTPRPSGRIDSSPVKHAFYGGASNIPPHDMPWDTEPQRNSAKLEDIINLKSKLQVDPGTVGETNSVQSPPRKRPDDELQKLKLRFETWQKDYKLKLQETQAALQKLSNAERRKSRRKWWGR